MSEHQSSLPLDRPSSGESSASPDLRDEIAAAWGLPIGQRVEVFFRSAQLDSARGVLELTAAPAFPWNVREELRLRIAGFTFTSRQIEHWSRL